MNFYDIFTQIKTMAYFIFAEEVLLFEGKKNDISKVCWVLDMDVFGLVLEHPGLRERQ